MATVDCDRDCRDDFDDLDDSFADPLAVADSGHSDAVRAAADGGPVSAPRAGGLHRIADVRRQQGVTLRNVARRLGIPLPVVRRQEQPDSDLRLSELLRWQRAQIGWRPDLGQQRIGAWIAVGGLNHDDEILQNQDARPTTKSASFASS